ncbi:hypothetical protein THASP1DRAFT_31703 [Thamnocephalis sphaerospora]|uniref:PX domain-containing protein n=1 Tax=Thamnocephalis sphaerospora TaxID=78915 RepID=A0A4P9XKY3_9FUNG|nr:hypothetical protein THASP1DRAFT_31703 [Thamnocephalis sphaerospora]|eukprot:RKP06478.1 hypothetical protein THASP1DRAFT_31703 [Thamnocephalis sphaerospora]
MSHTAASKVHAQAPPVAGAWLTKERWCESGTTQRWHAVLVQPVGSPSVQNISKASCEALAALANSTDTSPWPQHACYVIQRRVHHFRRFTLELYREFRTESAVICSVSQAARLLFEKRDLANTSDASNDTPLNQGLSDEEEAEQEADTLARFLAALLEMPTEKLHGSVAVARFFSIWRDDRRVAQRMMGISTTATSDKSVRTRSSSVHQVSQSTVTVNPARSDQAQVAKVISAPAMPTETAVAAFSNTPRKNSSSTRASTSISSETAPGIAPLPFRLLKMEASAGRSLTDTSYLRSFSGSSASSCGSDHSNAGHTGAKVRRPPPPPLDLSYTQRPSRRARKTVRPIPQPEPIKAKHKDRASASDTNGKATAHAPNSATIDKQMAVQETAVQEVGSDNTVKTTADADPSSASPCAERTATAAATAPTPRHIFQHTCSLASSASAHPKSQIY